VARYQHDYLGRNSRLDSIQAAVLSLKLRLLPGWNEQRRTAAERYQELLAGHPAVALPAAALGNTHVWHLFVIKVPDRDRVLTELAAAGIGAGVHYPAPIHRVKAFAGYFPEPEAYPVAETAADSILSLPMFPGITASQQERVVSALTRALR
jgi:dTDP-4-amino-4,6-dideoxygalactose transaminase